MTTLDNLVQEVRSLGLSGQREEWSQLAAGLDGVSATVTLAPGMPLKSIEPGAALQVDYELMGVLAVPNITTVTVQRAIGNSQPSSHYAGATVYVNPHFPAPDIIGAINADIDDLSGPTAGLYQMNTLQLTYNPAVTGYDLTGLTSDQVLEVREVRTWDYGSQRAWPLIPTSDWKLDRNAAVSLFPSGMSIKVYQKAYPGRPILIKYRSPFTTPLQYPTQDVEAFTGLHHQAHDIPVLGAAIRMMMFRELKRSFSEAQGEPRRAAEVPVGSSLTAIKGLQQLRKDRVDNERERLNKIYKTQRRP